MNEWAGSLKIPAPQCSEDHPISIAFSSASAHSLPKCFSSAPLNQPLSSSCAHSATGRGSNPEVQDRLFSLLPLNLAWTLLGNGMEVKPWLKAWLSGLQPQPRAQEREVRRVIIGAQKIWIWPNLVLILGDGTDKEVARNCGIKMPEGLPGVIRSLRSLE